MKAVMQLAERLNLKVHAQPFYSQTGSHVNGYYLYTDSPVKNSYERIMINGVLKTVIVKIKPRFNKDKKWSVYYKNEVHFLKANEFSNL